MLRLILAMVGAVTVFPLVFVSAVMIGILIIEQGMIVGYAFLPPEIHETFYRAGTIGLIINIVHGVILGAICARRVFNGITKA